MRGTHKQVSQSHSKHSVLWLVVEIELASVFLLAVMALLIGVSNPSFWLGLATGGITCIASSYAIISSLKTEIRLLSRASEQIRKGKLNAYPSEVGFEETQQLVFEFQQTIEKLRTTYSQEHILLAKANQTTAKLEEATSQLKALDAQRTEFINTAAHQLRTPLSVLSWSLDILDEESRGLKTSKNYKTTLEDSLRTVKRMVELVNDLLDASRLEQNKHELTWKQGNYAEICKQVVDSLQLLAKHKGLTLSCDILGTIPQSYLDTQAFFQIINNFVDNAIKYTVDGYVRLSCEAESDQVVITIADSGIGMDEDVKKSIFTQFARGSAATHLFPNGSGLGMYVAQAMLHLHGGYVQVESHPGKGTTFRLWLPIYQSPPTKLA